MMRPVDVEIEVVAGGPVEPLAGRRLLVLLHGRGADERDLLPLAGVLGTDDVVLSPRGPFPLGPGFAWAAAPVLGDGEGPALAAAADAMLRWLDRLAIDHGEPAAVRLLGFSQGGALAVALLRRAPSRFDRIVVLSGFVAAEELEPAIRTVPVLFAHGDADPVIPAELFAAGVDWLRDRSALTVRVRPGLGHGIDDRELAEVADYLR